MSVQNRGRDAFAIWYDATTNSKHRNHSKLAIIKLHTLGIIYHIQMNQFQIYIAVYCMCLSQSISQQTLIFTESIHIHF